MNKKITIIGLILLVVPLLLWGGIFYWKNLRGAGPSISNPPGDIAKIIDESVADPVNNTPLPLSLPTGFAISIFAKNLGAPRVMQFDSGGTMLVSIPSEGRIVALPDKDGDGKAEETITVISGLNRPHGMAMRCMVGVDAPMADAENPCKLYIAEEQAVSIYDYDEKTYKASGRNKIIDLPGDGGHNTRTILFMPFPNENKLLISVGSSCNVCNESDNRRAKVLIADADGKNVRTFAQGLRNSVFMAIHPVTGKIWATEMGRDLIGDDIPPDEINILEAGDSAAGSGARNYGWPVCYGKNIHDTDFDKNTYIRNPCMEPFETPSVFDIPAHSAPLGLAFFPEEGWPESFWHNMLVAYHGSWNRTTPSGYKIVRYKLDEKGAYRTIDSSGTPATEDFITGWLTPDGALGRPVDILIQPGGIIYISDDKAGVIYRMTYGRNEAENPVLPAETTTTDERIRPKTPRPGDVVNSPLIIEGEARGNWYFEATFPVRLIDANGKVLAEHYAEALSDWMTTNFVTYRSKLEFKTPATETGTLILEKDNPSGLPENAAVVHIPVRFR